MAVSELVLALDRPAVVEVGDRVVATAGEAVLAEHRVEGEGRAGGEAGQQHPCGEAAWKPKEPHGSRYSAGICGQLHRPSRSRLPPPPANTKRKTDRSGKRWADQ